MFNHQVESDLGFLKGGLSCLTKGRKSGEFIADGDKALVFVAPEDMDCVLILHVAGIQSLSKVA